MRELMINPEKTSAMILIRKFKPGSIEPLKLWGKEINYNSVKNVGVYMDPKLSWKTESCDRSHFGENHTN